MKVQKTRNRTTSTDTRDRWNNICLKNLPKNQHEPAGVYSVLLLQRDKTNKPQDYRPITCLPIIYKILSYKFQAQNRLLPVKQKGCSKEAWMQRPAAHQQNHSGGDREQTENRPRKYHTVDWKQGERIRSDFHDQILPLLHHQEGF